MAPSLAPAATYLGPVPLSWEATAGHTRRRRHRHTQQELGKREGTGGGKGQGGGVLRPLPCPGVPSVFAQAWPAHSHRAVSGKQAPGLVRTAPSSRVLGSDHSPSPAPPPALSRPSLQSPPTAGCLQLCRRTPMSLSTAETSVPTEPPCSPGTSLAVRVSVLPSQHQPQGPRGHSGPGPSTPPSGQKVPGSKRPWHAGCFHLTKDAEEAGLRPPQMHVYPPHACACTRVHMCEHVCPHMHHT